jgi:hypothetical protein
MGSHDAASAGRGAPHLTVIYSLELNLSANTATKLILQTSDEVQITTTTILEASCGGVATRR